MPRGGWRRTYIRLYSLECLQGSIRYQLSSAERGVWYDLLNFANLCDEPGKIADNDGRGYPIDYVANRLNIDLALLEKTIEKCKAEGRIEINGSGAIQIVNWKAYQSEYQRQKVYRTKDKDEKESFKKCPSCDFKGKTAAKYCLICPSDVELQKDYKAGKYGGHVQG